VGRRARIARHFRTALVAIAQTRPGINTGSDKARPLLRHGRGMRSRVSFAAHQRC
jgi:hypothetical protein